MKVTSSTYEEQNLQDDKRLDVLPLEGHKVTRPRPVGVKGRDELKGWKQKRTTLESYKALDSM
jgi:hypothetical protein